MKLKETETGTHYILEKERPYQDLISWEGLGVSVLFFVILYMLKLYYFIPVLIILALLATWQTTEDHFRISVNKDTKLITVKHYYLGIWKTKEFHLDGADFKSVQIEKQVTSIKEDGRFHINLLTETTDSDKEGETFQLIKNIDLEDLPNAKTLSFMLDILYEIQVKYRAGLID